MRTSPRVIRWLAEIVLTALLILALERWRGQRALRNWQREMTAGGEVFEARQLWPALSSKGLEFTNRLGQAVRDLPPRLSEYAGQLSGIFRPESTTAQRGSQQTRPPMTSRTNATSSWPDLDRILQQAQPTLRSIRELMREPPSSMGSDPVRALENNTFPNFVAVRIAAQALQSSAINKLHRADMEDALEDLMALFGFEKLYSSDPDLVSFMIRIAVIGLAVDVAWDALQAGTWTEPQLARLQQACPELDPVLSQMARTMEGERVGRLYQLEWLQSHSYDDWLARCQPMYHSFGFQLPAEDTLPPIRLL